jgi:DNA-binding response OmpR family regulator
LFVTIARNRGEGGVRQQSEAEHARPQSKPRILIADADEDTRALYRTVLDAAGFEVIEAAEGRTALTSALLEPPALVLTEIALPLVDGAGLCDILRRDAATRAVPVLVVTGESRANQLTRIRGAGANAVLVKPTPPESILAEVRRLLEDNLRPDDAPPSSDNGSATTDLDAGQNGGPANGARSSHAKSHARFRMATRLADSPTLRCPSCDQPLTYDHTYIGGVSERHAEQWDYYICASCGPYQYRRRTRKLRRVSAA